MADTQIVAIEAAGDGEIELFKRINRELARERRKIHLFVLLARRELMAGFHGGYRLRELAGDFPLRFLVELDSLETLDVIRRHLRQRVGKDETSQSLYQLISDSVEQHLILTGTTSFLRMRFDDLRRMQLAIAVCVGDGQDSPAPSRESDRIAAIAITDSEGFEHVLSGHTLDEPAILQEFVRIVRERDPDVIEGHHLLHSMLEYIEARARRYKIPLALGRDGQALRGRASRLQIAERTIAYRRYEVYGRNLVDTWLLAHHYDIASRELDSFELPDLCRHFDLGGIQIALDSRAVARCLLEEPAQLEAYVLDNARSTRSLAASLSQSYFVQAQIFPYAYQDVILRGNATKIDALLMRSYLAQSHSIPLPNEPSEVAGGYTEMRRTGIARNVLHCDVASLYPSLMIEGRHAPTTDRLGVFLRMLEDLRRFRLQAKSGLREVEGADRRDLEALQQTFKILINSFYGYLGFSLGHFNDFAQANVVTRRGRELIQRAIVELEARGAQVIEVDTDGIYFAPPAAGADREAVQQLMAQVGASMPEGIRLEIDGEYRAMFSYKMKNYVLLDERGELTIRGSGLKSRGLERFQRNFMEEAFRLLLAERKAELLSLYDEYRRRIETRTLGIRELMKTETLQDSLETYQQKRGGKRRNVAAAYELALRANRKFSSGDQISYYVTGQNARVKVADAAKLASEYDPAHPDENRAYYLAKLEDLHEKFRPFAERPELLIVGQQEAADDPSVQSPLFRSGSGE